MITMTRGKIDSAKNCRLDRLGLELKGGNMGKSSFIAMAAVTMALAAVPFTGASAGDDSGGYNSSDTDTVTIGSDPNTGGATQQDYDQMQSIQQGIEDLKQGHDAAPDNYSPDVSTQSDDSSGH